MTSPLQRSKAQLEAEGWLVAIVEHWNSFARVRQDLWGWADLLCLKGDQVIAVQVCCRGDVAKRARKIGESSTIDRVRQAGIGVRVHGWGRMADGRVRLREVDVS